MASFPPKVILCPTDFSPLAGLALRYAAWLAGCGKPHSDVISLYAEPFEPPPYFTARQEDQVLADLEQHRRSAELYLVEHVKQTAPELRTTEALVVQARPADAILETARKRGAGLIVMGTHGRGGVRRFMLGSVTERVLAEAPCAVLTVRERGGEGRPGSPAIEQVICPVDFSEISLVALEQAVGVARCSGAELLVVHVLETAGSEPPTKEEVGRLCAWIPDDLRAGCSLKEVVRRGNAAEQIIGLAEGSRCDLIVLGAQHKRFLDATVVGTTVVRVTRHAPCPVMTVIQT